MENDTAVDKTAETQVVYILTPFCFYDIIVRKILALIHRFDKEKVTI